MIEFLFLLWEGSLTGKVFVGSLAIIVLSLGVEAIITFYDKWAKDNEEEL